MKKALKEFSCVLYMSGRGLRFLQERNIRSFFEEGIQEPLLAPLENQTDAI